MCALQTVKFARRGQSEAQRLLWELLFLRTSWGGRDTLNVVTSCTRNIKCTAFALASPHCSSVFIINVFSRWVCLVIGEKFIICSVHRTVEHKHRCSRFLRDWWWVGLYLILEVGEWEICNTLNPLILHTFYVVTIILIYTCNYFIFHSCKYVEAKLNEDF